MNDLTVSVYADAEEAIEQVHELRDALEEVSQVVDELEEKGITVEISVEGNK